MLLFSTNLSCIITVQVYFYSVSDILQHSSTEFEDHLSLLKAETGPELSHHQVYCTLYIELCALESDTAHSKLATLCMILSHQCTL